MKTATKNHSANSKMNLFHCRPNFYCMNAMGFVDIGQDIHKVKIRTAMTYAHLGVGGMIFCGGFHEHIFSCVNEIL